MYMPAKKYLPPDIIRVLVDYLPSNSDLMALGLACGKATIHSLQAIWRCPRPRTIEDVEKLTRIVQLSVESKTTNQNGSIHLPYYYAWITGYDFSTLHPEFAAQVTGACLTTLLTVPILPLETLNTSHLLALAPTLVNRHIPSLRDLNLSSCTQFSSAALIQLLTSNSASILTRLNLSNCSVNDAVIIHISRIHTRIRHLDLMHSGNISDSAILALADGCLNLETLVISLPHGLVQSNKITDKSMEILARSCSKMQVVICRGQTRISEKSSAAFQKHCSMLSTCDFSTEQRPHVQ
jgi:hypothetical protein